MLLEDALKPSFAIVGCGKLGKVLAKYLTAAGYRPAGFASRSLSSAEKAARIAGTDDFSQVPWEMSREADIVFITTPDDRIEATCREIAENGGFKPRAVVLHCSGAHPSTILAPATKSGAFTASMHPLQSFAADEYPDNPFKGIVISVEGEEPAVSRARSIAEDLEARCFTIRTTAKTLYHASAVVASNYLVTLLDLAFRLIGEAGIAEKDAPDVLYPLVEGTLANIRTSGIQNALTGPIVRGDVETVSRHLDEIRQNRPDGIELYKTLGRHTLHIARRAGTLSDRSVQQLNQLLSAADG